MVFYLIKEICGAWWYNIRMNDLKEELAQLKTEASVLEEKLITNDDDATRLALRYNTEEQTMIERFLHPKAEATTTDNVVTLGWMRC